MDSVRHSLALAVVAAIGAWFRIVHLDAAPGLNPDEVEVVLQWFRDPIVPWYVAPSGRPHVNPLGPFLLWPFAALASPAPWVVRMPALLAGLALIPVFFLQVSKTFGRPTAAAATLLACSAPILIAYSRIGWDPAFVPVLVALAIGFAIVRHALPTIVAMAALILVHPTATFVLVLAAAPFVVAWWNGRGGTPRAWLGAGALIGAYFALIIAMAGPAARIPLTVDRLPDILARIVPRLLDGTGFVEFGTGYLHALGGAWVYTGFTGVPAPPPLAWLVIVVLAAAVGAGVLFARQRAHRELTLLVGLAAGLVAQYLSQGPEFSAPYRERYLLWSVVPSCLLFALAARTVFRACRLERWAPFVSAIVSVAWLVSFQTGYISPLRTTGGDAAVLDYRTSAREPKLGVLDIVRGSRRFPEAPATVFVGEARLELALLYLASRDSQLEIRNLGKVLYRYYQQNDRAVLAQMFDGQSSVARDVFFVDYEWDRLPGEIREAHEPAASSTAAAVAPWTAAEVGVVPTADGRPLLKVWRLIRSG